MRACAGLLKVLQGAGECAAAYLGRGGTQKPQNSLPKNPSPGSGLPLEGTELSHPAPRGENPAQLRGKI